MGFVLEIQNNKARGTVNYKVSGKSKARITAPEI